MDTASEVEDFFGTSGYVPQDSNNLKGSYGNSEFDQRRALIFTYVYRIPYPKFDNAFEYVLKDWQISGTTTMRDGLAAPLLTFGDRERRGELSHSIRLHRPDSLPVVGFHSALRIALVRSRRRLPARSAIARAIHSSLRACTPGTFPSNEPFKFKERFGFEFRTSFFNTFNHPNFAEPSPDLSTTISATADDGSFDSHFGVGGPRNIQFMGKFSW